MSDRELLIEMRGDIGAMLKDNQRTNDDLREMRRTVGELVAHKHKQEGEQIGFGKAVKAVYALATVSGLGGIAAAAKVLIG